MWTKRALHVPLFMTLLWLSGREHSALAQQVIEDACTTNPICNEHDVKAGDYFQAQKDYAKALVEYQRAYTAVPTPRLLINIGRCFFRLGKAEEATRYYERYQREVTAPSPEESERLTRYLDESRSVLLAQRTVEPPRPIETLPPPPRSIYKQWWFWTASGFLLGAAAVGIGVGIAVNQPPLFVTTTRRY